MFKVPVLLWRTHRAHTQSGKNHSITQWVWSGWGGGHGWVLVCGRGCITTKHFIICSAHNDSSKFGSFTSDEKKKKEIKQRQWGFSTNEENINLSPHTALRKLKFPTDTKVMDSAGTRVVARWLMKYWSRTSVWESVSTCFAGTDRKQASHDTVADEQSLGFWGEQDDCRHTLTFLWVEVGDGLTNRWFFLWKDLTDSMSQHFSEHSSLATSTFRSGTLFGSLCFKHRWGPGESVGLSVSERRREGDEQSSVTVMAVEGKLRCGELFSSASVGWWPLFTLTVSASSPLHTPHNSFSSQSAPQCHLSDCHSPWFITSVPATAPECHQASATLKSHYKDLVSHPDLLLGSSCLQLAKTDRQTDK